MPGSFILTPSHYTDDTIPALFLSLTYAEGLGELFPPTRVNRGYLS
jgi:hypothetical protein